MDGTHVRWDAMNNCTDQQYWDTLVCQCIPCSLVCGQPTVRRCAALCESMDCNRRAGFYYDELLKRCINCTTVCGQHPKQCAPSCEPGALVATPPAPAALVSASPPVAVLEQKVCAEQEPWLVVYLLLGLCLCALICSLLLGWTHLRRKGEVVSCQASAGTCHRGEDSSKGECWLRCGDWKRMRSVRWAGSQIVWWKRAALVMDPLAAGSQSQWKPVASASLDTALLYKRPNHATAPPIT
ncbi:tumor necrosis factor receptor superfamily member 13B [Grus japonensis]|uniref:Tumor necrosis factor receptor superfamily member 13B n=1 Tax=Grus japonensis TaxID=30415 RepID=A0ABC9XFN3_GRUJA